MIEYKKGLRPNLISYCGIDRELYNKFSNAI